MAGPYVSNDERNYIGFGHQTVKGTPVAPTHFGPFLPSPTLDHGQEVKEHYEGGNGPFMSLTEKLKHDPSGKIPLFARPKLGGFLGAHLLGVDTVSGGGPFTHVLTPDQVSDFVTVEQGLADEIIDRVTDGVIWEIVYSGKAGDANNIMQQVSWLGITIARQASAATETYETDRPFHWDDCVFTLDTAGATDVSEFSMGFRVKLDDNIRTGGVKRAHVLKLLFESELTVVQLMNSDAAYRLVNFGSPTGTAVQSQVSAGDFTVDANYGAGASARQMKLEFVTLDWHSAKPSDLNPDGETVYLTRTGKAKRAFGVATPMYRQTWKTGDSASYLA